jgi:hypothetical protein
MSDAAKRRSARLNLLALAVVGLLPFVGSWVLYWLWEPEAHVNYGELIAPLPLDETRVPADLRDLRGKWFFLTVDSGACDEHCRRKLYAMRQVRLTQGQNMERVERVWLIDDGRAAAPELTAQHAGLRIVHAQASELLSRLPVATALHDHVYLVDPLGNVILRYPRDADPSRMKRDLNRLLRASRIG